jgi:hypothetical protein
MHTCHELCTNVECVEFRTLETYFVSKFSPCVSNILTTYGLRSIRVKELLASYPPVLGPKGRLMTAQLEETERMSVITMTNPKDIELNFDKFDRFCASPHLWDVPACSGTRAAAVRGGGVSVRLT